MKLLTRKFKYLASRGDYVQPGHVGYGISMTDIVVCREILLEHFDTKASGKGPRGWDQAYNAQGRAMKKARRLWCEVHDRPAKDRVRVEKCPGHSWRTERGDIFYAGVDKLLNKLSERTGKNEFFVEVWYSV